MPNTPVNIAEKLMTVRLNCSFSWGTVTDKVLTTETNVNKGTRGRPLRVRKDLFPGASGAYLRALHTSLAKFYQYHKNVTMEGTNEGERLLPVAFLLDYDQEFNTNRILIDQAYSAFEQNYPLSISAAQNELNTAFNMGDYPALHDLRRYLNFRKLCLPLPDAGKLLNVVGASVEEDVKTYLEEAVQTAFADVHARAKGLLENMVHVLQNPKGRVHDSLLGKLVDLVSYIPEFNVTQDDSLNLLAEEIKTRLLVYNAGSLADRTVRNTVADEALAILRKMGA